MSSWLRAGSRDNNGDGAIGDGTPDRDADGVADCRDKCPKAEDKDDDGDMVIDCLDKCPDDIVNDPDNEGIGAAVDNCPAVSNATQADGDYDGMGDACGLEICDGICDKIDACADDPNNDIYGGGLCAQTEEGGAVRSAMSLRRVTPCRSITTSTWRLETLVAERRRGRKRARAAASARRTHARQTAAGADRWRP